MFSVVDDESVLEDSQQRVVALTQIARIGDSVGNFKHLYSLTDRVNHINPGLTLELGLE